MFNLQSCRVCLQTETQLTDMSTKGVGDDASFMDKLLYCIPEIVEETEVLLSLICSKCAETLTIVANFKKLCIMSHQTRTKCVTTLKNSPPAFEPNAKLHLQGDLLTCPFCNQKFPNRAILSRHVNRHTGERNYVCSTCGKKFFSSSDLNHHNQRHADKRQYQCRACDKRFNTASNLRSHNLTVHVTVCKYSCKVCGKKCVSQTVLNVHTKRHNNGRDFGCHLCDKRFVTNSELKKHVPSHSNVRPYKCTLCSSEYKNDRILKRHVNKKHHKNIETENVLAF